MSITGDDHRPLGHGQADHVLVVGIAWQLLGEGRSGLRIRSDDGLLSQQEQEPLSLSVAEAPLDLRVAEDRSEPHCPPRSLGC